MPVESPRIVLGREPPFAVGDLQVAPALRQVTRGSERRTLDPRVMQVLVALGQRPGEPVSRDELIERCWDGRAVSDGAINRAVSILRQLLAELGGFSIETVTKVGYILNPSQAAVPGPAIATPPEPPGAKTDRRALLIGLGGAGVAVAAGAAWWTGLLTPRRMRAEDLHRAGLDIERRSDPANVTQAIRFYEQAVAADPAYAPAQGALALALARLAERTPADRVEPIADRVQNVAARALALDPGNADALAGRLTVSPIFRNWAATEALARAALARRPTLTIAEMKLGLALSAVGRLRDGLAVIDRVARREPMSPNPQIRRAWLLAQTGRTGEADRAHARAHATWPLDEDVITTRLRFFAEHGDGRRAAALASRIGLLLAGGPLPPALATRAANALARPGAADRRAAVSALLEARSKGEIASMYAIPLLAALGEIDGAFEVAYGYYFGQRSPVTGERTPLPRTEERWTDLLFGHATAPMRKDPRFPALLAAVGIDRHWRETGARPDEPGLITAS